MGTALRFTESQQDIHAKAESYLIPAEVVDGMNVVAVEATALRAAHAVRTTGTPCFLECRTYRFRAHSMFDAQLYRTKDEITHWMSRDTPLPESTFTGAGIGAALGGMRPIIKILTVNFSLLAADQIINTAAILLHMSGGQFNVPLVIRMATGAGRQLAAQHSHSLEGVYAHVPGLKVLAPATIAAARGMLWPALEDPNPVLIFEHVMLYNSSGPAPTDTDAPVDITRAVASPAARRLAQAHRLVAAAGRRYSRKGRTGAAHRGLTWTSLWVTAT